jgi:MFS family permease
LSTAARSATIGGFMEAAATRTTLAEDLKALLRAPRELWLLYLATFFEWLGVFSFLPTLPLWLTGDFAMDDKAAGWWAATFATVMTGLIFVVGSAADALGVRRTLILAFALAAVSRLGMSLSGSPGAAISWLMVFALAYATISPVVQAAIGRVSGARTRAFAYSFWYVSFNLAGTLSGPLVIDLARSHFLDPATGQLVRRAVTLPLLGERLVSAHAVIMGVGFFFALAGLFVTLLLRRGFEDRAAPGEAEPPERKKAFLSALADVAGDRVFWRFVLLMVFLALVRMMFQHMHFTWPKYVLREQGEAFPIGTVWSFNSLLILFLAPLATALTRHRRPFEVLLAGAFVSAASPFVLCLGSSMPYQIAMILVLTVGEALWSPRLYEYNIAIAPRGREATYVSLATLPYFLAKFLVGPTSGYLLDAFCPASGPRRAALLWAVIGLSTMLGPVGILLGRRWMTGERGKAEAAAAA